MSNFKSKILIKKISLKDLKDDYSQDLDDIYKVYPTTKYSVVSSSSVVIGDELVVTLILG